MRRVECELGIGEDESQNVNAEGRNSCSQKCEGDENLRLCSLMFAYVRLCSLNSKKILEGAAHGHDWGLLIARNDEQAKPVRNDRRIKREWNVQRAWREEADFGRVC